MFSGIVEERGEFVGRDGARHRFRAPIVQAELAVGDSIAVNGVGLTVMAMHGDGFVVQLSDETLARTNLGELVVGDSLNVERPVRMQDRMKGHQMLGMIDCTGHIVQAAPGLKVRMPRPLLRYCVEKGSIAIDGVSLAIAAVDSDHVMAAIIPYTMGLTTLGVKAEGATVNIEVDIMAKHLEKLLDMHHPGI